MQLSEKLVVVTGAGSGIGEALARAAAASQARHVVVSDIDGDQAKRVADEIGGTAMQLDVRNEAAMAAMVETVESAYGPIELFCSNAGYVTSAGLEESNERIQAMWEVHVMAHIYAARAVIPAMIANGGGYLLNTASAAGLLTQVGSMSYTITKSAAISLAEWIAVSHHHQGIRVSVLCPQAVRTNIIANSPDRDVIAPGEDEGSDWSSSAASVDGVLSASETAEACLAAIDQERFLVLPHDQVATYVERKAADVDRWLEGMRRFQASLYPDGPLPGDAIVT